jgi:hypothetical protein
MEIGRVAALEDVEKATRIGLAAFLNKSSG